VVVHTGGGGGRSLVNKIKGGSYTDKQFWSLSPEEKKWVLKLCKEAKKKKHEKRKAQKKRWAARLKSECAAEEEDEPTEEMMGANAGAQFSAAGNWKKHQQSWLASSGSDDEVLHGWLSKGVKSSELEIWVLSGEKFF
jgi:hypothetical protein